MKCPKCDAELDSDFGLVTCQNCGAVSVFDMDGSISSDEGQPESTGRETPLVETSFQEESPELFVEDPVETPLEPQSQALAEASIQGESSYTTAPAELPADFSSEVTGYGNKTVDHGPISYEFIISEINTDEDRKVLKKALKDPKFQWKETELMDQVQSGVLEIKDLSPAKAFVLLRNLRGTRLRVKWKQHVF